MLVETLRADWTARGASARRTNAGVCALPEFDGGALTLGAGTKIAEARGDRCDEAGENERAVALVSVALGRPLDASAATHVRRALARAREGDAPLALTHLALAGTGRLTEPRDDARRLFIADGLMKAGISPRMILAALGGAPAPADLDRAYDPDQPRVPAGNGRPSGRWTSGDWADEANDSEQTPELEHPSSARDAQSAKPTQIADASANWAQNLNPVGPANAAERSGAPFNGVGPNDQHARAVAESEANFASLGLIILNRGQSVAVKIDGFATPRIYDFVALDPETGELVGVEVKSTKYDTIFFNPFQVDKDVAIYTLGGVFVESLGGRLTSVAYDAACDGCEQLNFRTYYLHWKLQQAGISVYTRQYIWRGDQ
ncbi:MAG: hypothetical protein ABR878_13030 [Roseiarcus sp.]